MKFQTHFLCCFILIIKTVQINANDSFTSCSDDFKNITFNCVFVDNKFLHRNYFNKNVTKFINCTTTVKPASYSTWSETSVREMKRILPKRFSFANVITLKNCRIPVIPDDFIQRLEHVVEINFDGSGIKSFDNETFSNRSSLQKISMAMNDIADLPGYLFSQTPNISVINLSRNRISHIDRYTFHGTTKTMKIIDLSHNNIEKIDESLFVDLINLEVLDLGHNFLQDFRVDLSKLVDLMELRLDNNKLVRLDCAFFNLATNKIEIDVNFNHIRKIDLNCDVDLESLELNIDDNQLASLTLPKSKLLLGLTQLNASRNHMENVTFQGTFGQLTALNLHSNHLKDLIEWDVAKFPKLQYLDISSNDVNCTYLTTFLKNLSKAIDLGQQGSDTHSHSDDDHKTRKIIHGINCSDDPEEDSSSWAFTENVLFIIGLCVLALVLGAVLLSIHLDRVMTNVSERYAVYHQNRNG